MVDAVEDCDDVPVVLSVEERELLCVDVSVVVAVVVDVDTAVVVSVVVAVAESDVLGVVDKVVLPLTDKVVVAVLLSVVLPEFDWVELCVEESVLECVDVALVDSVDVLLDVRVEVALEVWVDVTVVDGEVASQFLKLPSKNWRPRPLILSTMSSHGPSAMMRPENEQEMSKDVPNVRRPTANFKSLTKDEQSSSSTMIHVPWNSLHVNLAVRLLQVLTVLAINCASARQPDPPPRRAAT